MKSFLIGAFTLLLSIPLFAQNGYQPFTVSHNPSAQELTQLFTETTQGLHDPFLVLGQVSSKGDKAVPALRAFLANRPQPNTGSTITVQPNRVYGVMALDLIGTPTAYQILATVAQSDSSGEVRGMALRSLVMSCYYKTIQDSLSPDKGVVHLLLRNADDTTYVQYCALRIGDIARQGLKNWTGVDYGDMLPDSMRVQEEQRLGMALPQYREQWWQQNSGKINWNKDTGHFEIKK